MTDPLNDTARLMAAIAEGAMRALDSHPLGHQAREEAEAARTLDALVSVVLMEHGRDGIGRCRCGWDELGRSHSHHVTAALRHEGALLHNPDPERTRAALAAAYKRLADPLAPQ